MPLFNLFEVTKQRKDDFLIELDEKLSMLYGPFGGEVPGFNLSPSRSYTDRRIQGSVDNNAIEFNVRRDLPVSEKGFTTYSSRAKAISDSVFEQVMGGDISEEFRTCGSKI